MARAFSQPISATAFLRDALRAIPLWHFVIATGLGLVWGLANALGWTIGHATSNVPQTAAHFVYEALLPMLLLAIGIGIADVATRNDPNAVAPYAIAAISAAIVGETLFSATIPLLGLSQCGCNMDRWAPGMRTANMLPDSLLICGFVTAGYRYWRRASLRLARLRARELERATITRRMMESRLQAMQACIEPQFLFDTLAEVERVHASDPKIAGRLIDELIIYLRAALPHLRESSSTVAKETELAHAWLNIRRLRDRTGPTFEIDVRGNADGASMPPMLVLPLIDYVLGDRDDSRPGCAMKLAARVVDNRLRFEITARESAGGASAAASGKLGRLRERLTTLYGDDAKLTVAHDHASDLVLTLDLPYESADSDPR